MVTLAFPLGRHGDRDRKRAFERGGFSNSQQQFGRRDTETVGKDDDIVKRRAAFSALDTTDIASVKPYHQSELRLGQLLLFAQLFNLHSQLMTIFDDMLPAFHATNAMGDTRFYEDYTSHIYFLNR